MDTFLSVIVFLMVWWIVLFAVLPWGVKTESQPEKGHATSAPVKPRLLLKFGVTTAISLLIWWGIILMIEARVVTFDYS